MSSFLGGMVPHAGSDLFMTRNTFLVAGGESLQSLSAEQLAQLEGMERANVEARIAVLRDVQKLLDSAVLRLNQYSAVMATIR